MNRVHALAAVLLLTLTASAQEDAFFEPYKNIDLRLPAVPLIVNDPYISFWSPYDKLTDGVTRHWSNIKKPMDGLLRVDGKVYRWMGQQQTYILGNPLLPMASDKSWSAKAYIGTTAPATGITWTREDYDDSAWETKRGAFGCPYHGSNYNCPDDWHTNVGTEWYKEGTSVYIRRHLNLTAEDLQKELYVKYSHDDYFYLFINGRLAINTGYNWAPNEVFKLKPEMMAYLHEGDNVIAVRCQNQTGGAYCDFGIYENLKVNNPDEAVAVQRGVDVLACNTFYNFKCGPVNLDVVFTAPMIIDDLESISTPINYISYRVTSNDGQEHDVQFYYGFTSEMTVYNGTQATVHRTHEKDGRKYVNAGTQSQSILGRVGDMVTIDWGYIYLPAVDGGDVCVADYNDAEREFAAEGKITTVKEAVYRSANSSQYPMITFIKDLGTSAKASGYMMIGYDERYDIKYFNVNFPGYWARDKKTIYEAFEEMDSKYTYYMKRSRDMDKMIYDDAFNATNSKKYAELLSGTYRHVLAAHKLFQDRDGNLLYFSKENNSNGCVNTVDLTYPSAPLFLCYNTALEKGMITSILDYCYSGRWPYNFAAHDLGTYPHANGNVYGNPRANDGSTMPLEESANIIILAAYIAKEDGDLDYLRKYWKVLTSWNQFLVDNGKEPGNQLCTDDFKGASTRNANLAVKAIMGIASYAEMCKMLGYDDLYEQNMTIAHEYAHYWVDMDRSKDGTWYYMEFQNSNHWGLKYNMFWDKLWGWNIFNDDYTGDVMGVEIPYYLKRMKRYGLPLDSRDNSCKSDWNAWVAAMTTKEADFNTIMDAEWKFANETTSRWPLSDWHQTENASAVAFRGRSVIGGFWAKVLVEKNAGNLPDGIEGIQEPVKFDNTQTEIGRYNLSGQRLKDNEKGVHIVKYANGTARKVLVK